MTARRSPLLLALLLAACEGNAGAPSGWTPPPDEPFRQTRPALGPARPFAIPTVQSFIVADGVEVMLFERHTIPAVLWRLQYPGGSQRDPAGKEGRTELCAWLMLQSADDTADRLADYGSYVSENWTTEWVALNGFSLTANLDPILGVWGRFVHAPVVSATELERLRQRSISALPQALASPAAIAGRVLSVVSNGPGHPFARRPTADSYRAITASDCAQFVADEVRPRGSLLLVAGDITRAEVEAKFSPHLAIGAPPAMPAEVVPDPSPDPAAIVFADAPGASQTIIHLWAPGPARLAPDFLATSVMVEIFGGDALSSRLGIDLREMMGSTYTVGGSVNVWRGGGRMVISAPVQSDRTQAAIAAMVADAAKMRDGEVTDAELARARDGRVAALPTYFETVAGSLAQFSGLAYLGLPLDYYQGFAAEIARVDRAAVSAAARRYLAADQLRFVVVGDAGVVRPMLDALVAGGGPLAGRQLKVVTAEGKPLP